jgi:hypothetical protein
MIDRDEAEQLLDDAGHLLASDDSDLGPVSQIYLDEYTNWPSFVTIASTVPGVETLVALHEAELHPRGVQVPYPPTKIERAPQVNHGKQLSIEAENALFDYYDVPIEGAVPSVAHLGAVLEPGNTFDRVVDTPVA